MAPDHPLQHPISRRRALALGAAVGGTTLAAGSFDAFAATSSHELVVDPQAFTGNSFARRAHAVSDALAGVVADGGHDLDPLQSQRAQGPLRHQSSRLRGGV